MSGHVGVKVRFWVVDRDDLGFVDLPQLIERDWTLSQLRTDIEAHYIGAFKEQWGWEDLKGVGFLKSDKGPVSRADWEQPLSSFLHSPPSATDNPPTGTVAFILKPPQAAQGVASAAVPGGEAVSAGVTIGSSKLVPVLDIQYQLLYNAIRDKKVQHIGATRHLQLTYEGATWFQASNSILFVREVYPCLFDLLGGGKSWPYIFHEQPQGVALYGQPGIGKSVLGDYLLYRFLEHDWVVFVMPNQQTEKGYLFFDGTVYDGSSSTLNSLSSYCSRDGLFHGKPIIAILDSRIIGRLSFPAIMISSSGQMRKDDNKNALHSLSRLQIPMMAYSEMSEMQKVAFWGLSKEDCERRIQLWGCIPRYVFVKISEDEQRLALAELEAITARQFSDAVKGATTGQVAFRCHRIIQERCYGQTTEDVTITNRAYYRPGDTAFLSETLGAWAIDKFRVEKTWDLWHMVVNSGSIPDLATLRGPTFENVVWSLLHDARSYAVKQLGDTRGTAEWTLVARETRNFDSVDRLFEMVASEPWEDLEGVLFVPACRYFVMLMASSYGQDHHTS